MKTIKNLTAELDTEAPPQLVRESQAKVLVEPIPGWIIFASIGADGVRFTHARTTVRGGAEPLIERHSILFPMAELQAVALKLAPELFPAHTIVPEAAEIPAQPSPAPLTALAQRRAAKQTAK